MNPTTRRPLRWLVLASHVSADGSGGGMIRYTVECIRALNRRHDVQVSVLADPRAREFFTDLLGGPDSVHTTPPGPVPLVSGYERYALGRALRGHDVVHGTKHLLPHRFLTRALRTVLTVHDMLPMDRPRDFGSLKRTLIRHPYLQSARAADHLVCVSAATRQRLLSYVPEAADRATVVPLAAGGQLTDATPSPIAELDGRPFALVVGDDSPRKNLGLVLEAIQVVRRRLPDAVLAVAGPPNWGVSADGDLMRRLVDSGAVVPLGFVTDDQLSWSYQQARVVCCPSLLEGFGLPALEALRLGAPLLTSDDPALVEVSGASVPHLSSWDAAAWVEPLTRALAATRRTADCLGANPLLTRDWDDVAAETVAVVHGRR